MYQVHWGRIRHYLLERSFGITGKGIGLGEICPGAQVCSPAWPKTASSFPLGGFSVCAPAGWRWILFKAYHLIFFFLTSGWGWAC